MLANVFYFVHKKATVSKDKPRNEEEMLLEGSQKNGKAFMDFIPFGFKKAFTLPFAFKYRE